MWQALNPLRCHPNVEGDVSLSLVDRAGMNHLNGDVGSRGEHRAFAVVEVDIKVRLASGIAEVDSTPVVRADPAQTLIFCHDAGPYRQIPDHARTKRWQHYTRGARRLPLDASGRRKGVRDAL